MRAGFFCGLIRVVIPGINRVSPAVWRLLVAAVGRRLGRVAVRLVAPLFG